MELVDPKLGTQFNKEEAIRMIKVVSMLKGKTAVPKVLIMDPSTCSDDLKFNALRCNLRAIVPVSHSTMNDSSSTSSQGLYQINLHGVSFYISWKLQLHSGSKSNQAVAFNSKCFDLVADRAVHQLCSIRFHYLHISNTTYHSDERLLWWLFFPDCS